MIRRILSVLLFLTACASGTASAGANQPVIVFAAASLKTALDAVVADYRARTGRGVVVSYAGSSALARQIEYGAPADIFISANVDWMDRLEHDGLIEAGTRVALLTNRLVLIAAPGVDTRLEIRPGFDLAGALRGEWLAMALVDAVPAGIYGHAALTSLGVWEAVAPHVAQTDNVRTALALVAAGEAPLGIVYASDALADRRVRVVDVFPAGSHPAIVFPAALTVEAQHPAAAQFLGYLTGGEARAIFAANGFSAAREAP